MNYSVLIIGLGNIGMLYDVNLNEVNYAYSHSRAFSQHPSFTLIAAVDPSSFLRDKFSEIYHVIAYADISLIPEIIQPDVVVVATPTETHISIIYEIIMRYSPKVILCEKPLCYDSLQAKDVIQKCHEKGIQLFINYIRRADPGIIEVRNLLTSGQISKPIKAVVWYSKGLLHNGAHFVDLLKFWLGPVLSEKVICPGMKLLIDADAEPDFILHFETGTAIFCAANEENFSHYTIELVAKNGRLRYEKDGQIIWQPAVLHPTLPNYMQLQASSYAIKNDAQRYQYYVAEQIVSVLNEDVNTLCTGDIEINNIELLQKLINKCKEFKENE